MEEEIDENDVVFDEISVNDEILPDEMNYPQKVEEKLSDEPLIDVVPPNQLIVISEENSDSNDNENITGCNPFNIICPVCQKSFSADIIEKHADSCADKQRSLNIMQSSFSDESIYHEENDNSKFEQSIVLNDFIYPSKTEDCRKLLQNVINKCGIDIYNTDTIKITVFRGSCFYDFHKHFQKPWIEKLDPFCRYTFAFAGEEAIDEGGVSREFFTEALKDAKLLYFTGDDHNMEPVCSLHAVADGTMKTIGHLFAASLCNYGPAPNFIASWVFNYIVGGVEAVLSDLPPFLSSNNTSANYLCNVYKMLQQVDSDDALRTVLTSNNGYAMLQAISYRGTPGKATLNEKSNILRSIFLKVKVEPLTTTLEQIMVGLEKFELVKLIQEEPHAFRLAFCDSKVLMWTYDLFVSSLKVNWSEEGSNKRMQELCVYRVFIEMCELIFHEEQPDFELSDMIQFVCGCRTIAPIGVPELSLEFKHDCDKSQSGQECRCLPCANTCSSTLTLPIHNTSSEEIKESFSIAIKSTQKYGFGLG